jgi:hypothetical protein
MEGLLFLSASAESQAVRFACDYWFMAQAANMQRLGDKFLYSPESVFGIKDTGQPQRDWRSVDGA